MTNENLDMYRMPLRYRSEKELLIPMPGHAPRRSGLSLTLFFPDTATTRDINKAQIYAAKGIKSRITSGFASWRWKVLKLKAAYPARYKESHMKLSRIGAINWNKIGTTRSGGVEPADQ